MALDSYWDEFGIAGEAGPLDFHALFARRAPLVLEIGSGMGQTSAAMAAAHPENDYLAVEVHRPGVGSLLKLAHDGGLANIRVIMRDIVEVLEIQIPDRSLDEVYILFPDPWPKRRHHKRRLISPAFLDLLAPKLKENARLFLATDCAGLAAHMLETCDAHPALVNLAGTGNFAPRPARRIETRFERRGRGLRHDVRDLVYAPAGPNSGSNEERAGNSQAARGGA